MLCSSILWYPVAIENDATSFGWVGGHSDIPLATAITPEAAYIMLQKKDPLRIIYPSTSKLFYYRVLP